MAESDIGCTKSGATACNCSEFSMCMQLLHVCICMQLLHVQHVHPSGSPHSGMHSYSMNKVMVGADCVCGQLNRLIGLLVGGVFYARRSVDG